MIFRMEIGMDNAAFELQPIRELRDVIDRVIKQLATDRALPQSGICRDINGNTVGQWVIE